MKRISISFFCIATAIFVIFSCGPMTIRGLVEERVLGTNQSPIITSFTAENSTILIQGNVQTSTALSVLAEDSNGEIASFSYEIVSGGGSLGGSDTEDGKTYSSGSSAGTVTLKATVTDDRGDTAEETIDILVLEKGYQKISDTEGGFTGTLANGDYYGSGIATLGDLDGDGIGDIAVGCRNDDDGGSDRGALWILFLNKNGTVKNHQKISDLAGNFSGVLDDGDAFGNFVDGMGDLDGDGIQDIVTGAMLDDDGNSNRGAVWILFLNTDGTVKSHQKISDTEGNFTGLINTNDRFGSSVANLGDIDGDGVTDIGVGEVYDVYGADQRGACWILFLNSNGTVKSHQKISATEGGFSGTLNSYILFGSSIENINDLNGDGKTDIAVGAAYDPNDATRTGAFWNIFLDDDGTVITEQKVNDAAGGFTGSIEPQDFFAHSLASIANPDDGGLLYLAAGASGDDDGADRAGALWLMRLNADGTVESQKKISSTSGNFSGVLSADDNFGYSVEDLGDLDGDGKNEIAVGAYGDDDGGTDRGAVYILHLNPDGTVMH